jgi:hypothetical protein
MYSPLAVGADDWLVLAEADRATQPYATYYVFERRKGRWSVIDTCSPNGINVSPSWGVAGLWKTPWNTIYSYGPGVYEYSNKSWVTVRGSEVYLVWMFGTTPQNIFAVGQFATLDQFNGTNWYTYASFPPLTNRFTTEEFVSGWTDGKQVFVLGWDSTGTQTFVLHGQ